MGHFFFSLKIICIAYERVPFLYISSQEGTYSPLIPTDLLDKSTLFGTFGLVSHLWIGSTPYYPNTIVDVTSSTSEA